MLDSLSAFFIADKAGQSQSQHQHLLQCQDTIISTLISIAAAADINAVYLAMQSAVQALCSSTHCRIVTRTCSAASPVTFTDNADKLVVTVEIDQRQIRRTSRVVYVETESTKTECDDAVRHSLETLAKAASLHCVQIRRQQQIASDAQVAKGLLALRRQWQQMRPRQALSKRMLESFLRTTQDLIQAERIVAVVVDYHDNRLGLVPTDANTDDSELADYPMDVGILGAALAAKKAIVANNVQEHRLYRPKVDSFTDETMKQIICQPVFDRSAHIAGLIVAINHVNDKMEPSDSLINIDIHHGFADRDTDLLEQCCLEMNDFLLFYFTELSTRRATRSNIGAFSLVESYLGRSISEHSMSTDDDDKPPERSSSTELGLMRAISEPPLPVSAPVPVPAPEPLQPDLYTANTMSLAKRISLTETPEGQLPTLKFNVFDSSSEQLYGLCLTMMSHLDIFTKFDRTIVSALVDQIRQQYFEQPFHNWKHAVSVMHMTYLVITRHDDVRATLGIERSFALMIAALGHDVNHPGHNNQFEINSDSELAQKFNGKSVLENYHAACLMKILRNGPTDPFQHLEPALRRSLRESIIDSILGTDMSKHIVFNKRLESMDDRNALLSPESFADQNFLLETIVHAADLSAQGYDTPIAVEWESRITAEFRQQAALETSLGIPVANFMTDLDDDHHRAQLQVSFIDFVLRPFWKEVARLLPCVADVYHNIILRSRQYYTILKNEGKDSALAYLNSQVASSAVLATHSLRAHTFPTAQRTGSNSSTTDMSTVVESGPGSESKRGSGTRAVSAVVLPKNTSQANHTRLQRKVDK